MADLLPALRRQTPEHVLGVVDYVVGRQAEFVRWPKRGGLFMPAVVRIDYHRYTPEQRLVMTAARVSADSRSNGPAIVSFLPAGGERPARAKPRKRGRCTTSTTDAFPRRADWRRRMP